MRIWNLSHPYLKLFHLGTFTTACLLTEDLGHGTFEGSFGILLGTNRHGFVGHAVGQFQKWLAWVTAGDMLELCFD